jgi:signal transduction histidine kinase
MFRGLHLRLTLLYLLAALALVVLVGGSAYALLAYYFQITTDSALQHKMSLEFRLLGAPLPAELADADRTWYADRNLPPPTLPLPTKAAPSVGSEGQDQEGVEKSHDPTAEEAYDSELAAIFVLPLSESGQLLFDPNPFAPPLVSDSQAVAAALRQGNDRRTVRLNNGPRVRLLTYRLTLNGGPAVLQLGRTLSDQDHLLNQLLIGLLGLGGLSAVLLGAASWWLAGRSLVPAQQAWERQQSFVANASHELRTPLTLMRASAEVAQRGLPATDDRRELLGDVLQETDHMSRLVDDLLLLSRLDAGRLTLERTTIALPDLFTDIQRQVGRLADEHGVPLTVGEVSGAVRADPTRVRQVLLILLDNALRHTPSGGTIRLEARPQGKQVLIQVVDTGNGIAPEHLPHIFERFYRADAARNDQRGGSGLGLAIARALVGAQHGQIRVESRVGQGTRITVALPSAGNLP